MYKASVFHQGEWLAQKSADLIDHLRKQTNSVYKLRVFNFIGFTLDATPPVLPFDFSSSRLARQQMHQLSHAYILQNTFNDESNE